MNESVREQLALPPADQVGFVVRDLDAALVLYEPLFGPFQVIEPGPLRYDYRGTLEDCEMRIAFGRSGELEIELIQWLAGGCPHKEFIDAGREGMHHLRFIVADLDSMVAAAEALGYQAVWHTRYGPGHAVAYLERAGDTLLLEFYERHGA